MNVLNLTLTFKNFNDIVSFYTVNLGKNKVRAMSTLTGIGSKGQIIVNPDLTISLILYFKSKSKYDKFVNQFTKFTNYVNNGNN